MLLARSLAHPSPATFIAGITGTTFVQWQRRGKYLLAQLQKNGSAGWLGVHLRMTGQLLWLSVHEPLQKHTRIRLFLQEEQELRFVDMRQFGQMWWVPPEHPQQQIVTGLQLLGPEPFSAEFSFEYLSDRLTKSRRAIKTLLLDQRVVAGLGNIYADESLFKSQIHPQEAACTLTPEQVKRLRQAIIEVLQAAIDRGGTTFSGFLNLLGVKGNYGGVAWVYGRQGEPCRFCGTPIERIRLTGRSAHFCPCCQKRLRRGKRAKG